MGRIVFITGGARSGKSDFTNRYAGRRGPVLYVATYRRAGDEEMEERIRKHAKSRPKTWKVVEEPLDIASVVRSATQKFKTVLVDCVTLWVSNLLLERKTADCIWKEARELVAAAKRGKPMVVFVSNEVGMGVVPDTKMGRRFRDVAGTVNQIIAKNADEVYLMVSGIPVKIGPKAR